MKILFKKTAMAAALGATALTGLVATPAMADPYRGHRGGSDVAGAAVAGGIIGLALGAIIASSGHHDHDRYRDGYEGRVYNNRGYNGYYNNGGYNNGYYNNYQGRDGYRYDNDGRAYAYDREGYYRR